MTEQQADQIAHLLNTRNELVLKYNKLRVLQCSDNYLVRYDKDGNVVAFIEVVKVQWYQTELRHLTVAEGYERQGHARGLIQEAENIARSQRRGILQCTIRESNVRSRDVFQAAGFHYVSKFFYHASGNNVDVFQKIISPPTGY